MRFIKRELVKVIFVFPVLAIAVLAMYAISFALCAETVDNEDRYSCEGIERDPFDPLVSKTGQVLVRRTTNPASLVLKGIIYSKDGSIAIIGDELFKENDIINNYRIMKIGRKKVILKKDKKIIILKLEENNENASEY